MCSGLSCIHRTHEHLNRYTIHTICTLNRNTVYLTTHGNSNGIFLHDLLRIERDELLNSNFWPLGPLYPGSSLQPTAGRGYWFGRGKGAGGIRRAQKQLRPRHPLLSSSTFRTRDSTCGPELYPEGVRPEVRAWDRSIVVTVDTAATAVSTRAHTFGVHVHNL